MHIQDYNYIGNWQGTQISIQNIYGDQFSDKNAILGYLNGKKYLKQIEELDSNIDQLLQDFVNDIKSNKVDPYFKTEYFNSEISSPTLDYQKKNLGQFQQVSSQQIQNLLKNQKQTNENTKQQQQFLLFFKSKFCPLCSKTERMLQTFQKINTKNAQKGSESLLAIYQIDGQKNELPDLQISMFPTLYFYDGQKFQEFISENFDSRDLLKFLQPFLKKKQKLETDL